MHNMNYKKDNKVIIWGKDGYNPLGLLRELHDVADVTFLLFGGSKLCATKSRYCTNLHPTKRLNEGLEWLLSSYKDEPQKPFIIPTGDLVAEYIDQHKDKLEPYFHLTGTTEQGLLTKVLDKNYMNQLAVECGFLIPQSIPCQWDTDISKVKYPCLLKPNKNRLDHGKEFKTKKCSNEIELKTVLNNVSKKSCFVLQEFVQQQYDALVYGCRTDSGKIVLAGVLMKDRWDTWDGSHGYMTPELPNCISEQAIERFLSKIDYRGPFSVEFGIHDDRAYFFEFNLRNDGTSHYFYQTGVNIPQIWILDTLGVDYSDLPVKIDGYHDFIAIADDFFNNVTTGNISVKQWRTDKKVATVFRVYDKNDMKPYYYNLMVSALRPVRDKLRVLKKKLKK